MIIKLREAVYFSGLTAKENPSFSYQRPRFQTFRNDIFISVTQSHEALPNLLKQTVGHGLISESHLYLTIINKVTHFGDTNITS